MLVLARRLKEKLCFPGIRTVRGLWRAATVYGLARLEIEGSWEL